MSAMNGNGGRNGSSACFGQGPIWEALVNDAGASILVMDAAGTIYYANECAVKFLGGRGGPIEGRTIQQFFPPEVCEERQGYVARVLESKKPLVVEGLVRGTWRTVSIRPMPVTEGKPATVLVVGIHGRRCGTGGARAGAGGGAVRCRCDDMGALASLTARELEILTLIGGGLSTAAIAERLSRSVKTVEWHRVSLGEKLGAANRVELARIAIDAGLVET